ncbi:MAG: DNA recombination protein RmuC [Mycoplasmataceae bacterium]|jgi:DNA recombination protein RmuC|nr:DNA recombination protein RmuC [Mycoplasmataceae bacterium]
MLNKKYLLPFFILVLLLLTCLFFTSCSSQPVVQNTAVIEEVIKNSVNNAVLLLKEQLNEIKQKNEKLQYDNATLQAKLESIAETTSANAKASVSNSTLINEVNNSQKTLKEENTKLQTKIDNIAKVTTANTETFVTSSTLINEVNTSQKTLQEAQTKITEILNRFSNDVANVPSAVGEIKKLTGLFDNSKLRGNIGEKQLEMIIGSILPSEMFEMQATIGKLRPDCVITIGEEKYIVDAKFPKDNYLHYVECEEPEKKPDLLKKFKADVVSMIDDLTKYISDNNKNKVVIMFIPSDKILAEIDESLPEIKKTAYESHILLTSPTTLWLVLNQLLIDNDGHKLTAEYEQKLKELREYIKTFKDSSDELVSLVKKWNSLTKGFKDFLNKYKYVLDIGIGILDNKSEKEALKLEKKKINDVKGELETITFDNSED